MPSWGISLCCFSRFLSGSLKVHSRSWSHRGALVRLCVHWRFLRAGNSVPTKAWRVLRQPTPAPRKNRHGECWTPTGRTLSRHCCQGKQRASRNTKASIGSVPSFVSPLLLSLSCDKRVIAFDVVRTSRREPARPFGRTLCPIVLQNQSIAKPHR